jgi:putative FmdB family regulatory protein
MPIFEYHCFKCDTDFEKLVMGTNSQISCPDCGTMEIEKKFSTFGIKSGATFSSSGAGNGCSSCTSSSCSSCH